MHQLAQFVANGAVALTAALYFIAAGAFVIADKHPMALLFLCYGLANMAIIWQGMQQ